VVVDGRAIQKIGALDRQTQPSGLMLVRGWAWSNEGARDLEAGWRGRGDQGARIAQLASLRLSLGLFIVTMARAARDLGVA
jgi:hypothetical protein